MSYQDMFFSFLGGLGIFLFGIKYMGDGLQKAAGDRLREVLNKFTSTPLRAVLAGIIVTGLIQSSSGTTVLTVDWSVLVSCLYVKRLASLWEQMSEQQLQHLLLGLI